MRILHVTDVFSPRVGGIETLVEGLARAQARAGHEVTVLTQTGGKADSVGPVRVVRSPRGVSLKSFDVVHAHISVVSIFTTLVARRALAASVPTVLTVHSMWAGRELWVRLVAGLAAWRSRPPVWVAVSSAAARQMEPVLGEGTPVHVVPNAIEVATWRGPAPEVGSVVPDVAVTMVTVMRMAPRKRPLPLLRSLAEVRARVPAEVPLRAVLVGAGPQLARARRLADRLGLDWVTFTGAMSPADIAGIYREADVYVAPSLKESFGIAPLEARAAGLAVVAMGDGGVGEFIENGVEGVLCGSDTELVDALSRLAGEPRELDRVRTHNRAVPPVLDWETCVAGYDRVYARARSGRTGRARHDDAAPTSTRA